MNDSCIVGVTGGIGSGKSTVCNVIQSMGFPIFYADTVSKSLCDSNEELKLKLKEAFGDIYTEEGRLNRPLFASIIFTDEQKLHQANEIIHPVVNKEFLAWVQIQSSNLVFVESAILLESTLQNCVDKVILVLASEDIRIKRVIQRDNITQEQVVQRIKNQTSDDQRKQKAHYFILNDNNELLIPQIEKIINSLLIA